MATLAGFAFVTTTAIYRVSGDTGYGIWATVVALRNITLFLDGGLALGVTRDAARLSAERTLALPRIQAAQLGYRTLGITAVFVALAGSWIPGALLGLNGAAAGQAQALMALMGVDAGIVLAVSPISAVLRGWQRFDVLALGSGAHATIGTALLFAGLSTGGLVGGAAGLVVARGLVAVGYAVWLRGRTATSSPQAGIARICYRSCGSHPPSGSCRSARSLVRPRMCPWLGTSSERKPPDSLPSVPSPPEFWWERCGSSSTRSTRASSQARSQRAWARCGSSQLQLDISAPTRWASLRWQEQPSCVCGSVTIRRSLSRFYCSMPLHGCSTSRCMCCR